MHILLGLLGSIITVLVLLNRLAEAGIDLGGLNPFLWHRRRKWRKKQTGNPLFTLQNPMEVTAILMVAVAKADGDVSIEEKKLLQDLFHSHFHLNEKDAAGLLISSSFLLGDGAEFRNNLSRFIARSKGNFSDAQRASAVELISEVAGLRTEIHPNAADIVAQAQKEFNIKSEEGLWSASSS